MKKILIFIISIIVLIVFNAYASTQIIIDFRNGGNYLDYFELTTVDDRVGYGVPGASTTIKGGMMEFRSTKTDVFPLAYLSVDNYFMSKVQFDLQSGFSSGGKRYKGSHFTVDFNDGSSIWFYNNFDKNMNYVYYDPCPDWSDAFVVKDIDGKLYNLGTGTGESNVTYIIEANNGILSMSDSEGHSFEKNIGDRRIKKIKFHPLYQWNSYGTYGYLGNVIITTQDPLIESIQLTGPSSVKKGNVINLKANILPSDVENKNLTWTSSDSSVATVDGVGISAIVRGIKKGTVTIKAAARDSSGVMASKTITVTSDSIQGEAKYITIDDVVKYETGYSDVENDPKNGDEYKYIHNPYSLNGVTLDNSMGYVDFRDKWQDIAYTQFSKVGTYTVQYRVQDNPPTAATNSNFANYQYYSDYAVSTIYVHRKPIALYSISGSTVTDSSYDLDHSISHSTKGIVAWEWQYVNSSGIVEKYIATTKTDGINKVNSWLNSYKGVEYKIVLRVQDLEGAWSEPCLKTAGEVSRPVADFIIDKNPMLYKTDIQKITDMSYDTNGLALSYQWTVTKGGSTILSSTSKDISALLNTAINGLHPNVTGIYNVSLKVTNSSGVQSDTVTKSFEIIVNNQVPTADFTLISNESPAWSFPKNLGLHTLKYRPSSSFFHEEKTKFNVSVTDPNSDNTGFIYNWKLERFAVKDINNISGAAANTYNYTTQLPFTNSFKEQGIQWGAYRITLNVADIPPVPPYKSGDAKSASVTKNYYIVPELSLDGSFESSKSEIMVGDTIKLKAKTNKMVETVGCSFNGTGYALKKVSEDSNFAYWEKNINISDSITESGTYQLQFVGSTTYGGNGNITREIRDTVSLNIVALKLINFRISDIVNHPNVTFPYTKEMLEAELIPYKAGYYVTFRIDSKGKPDNVYGRIDIGNNDSIDQVINMKKVTSGDTETWKGRFYTSPYLITNTVISIKLDCTKGSTIYDYNLKENWNGRSLITIGSALQDGRVNLTN